MYAAAKNAIVLYYSVSLDASCLGFRRGEKTYVISSHRHSAYDAHI